MASPRVSPLMEDQGPGISVEGLPIPDLVRLSRCGFSGAASGRPVTEGLPAPAALVGLLSCMDPLVHDQVVVLAEGLSTLITGVRLLPSVSSVVGQEKSSALKHLPHSAHLYNFSLQDCHSCFH